VALRISPYFNLQDIQNPSAIFLIEKICSAKRFLTGVYGLNCFANLDVWPYLTENH
jgi:hypothetical protein